MKNMRNLNGKVAPKCFTAHHCLLDSQLERFLMMIDTVMLASMKPICIKYEYEYEIVQLVQQMIT